MKFTKGIILSISTFLTPVIVEGVVAQGTPSLLPLCPKEAVICQRQWGHLFTKGQFQRVIQHLEEFFFLQNVVMCISVKIPTLPAFLQVSGLEDKLQVLGCHRWRLST